MTAQQITLTEEEKCVIAALRATATREALLEIKNKKKASA